MTEHNPWKTLSTKEVYKNPWIRVREDSIIKPNGENGIYGVVESKIATGIIPLFDDQSTILVGQYRYAMDQYSWEIVEGGADFNEDPLTAAKRELEEEAGYSAAQVELLGGEIHLSNSHSSERGYLYIGRGLTPCEKRPDDTEVLTVKRLHVKEALELVESNQIQDSLSIIGLLRIARLLNL